MIFEERLALERMLDETSLGLTVVADELTWVLTLLEERAALSVGRVETRVDVFFPVDCLPVSPGVKVLAPDSMETWRVELLVAVRMELETSRGFTEDEAG